MMKPVFTKTKWSQSLGLGGVTGRERQGKAGQEKDRKCFLPRKVLAGSQPQLTGVWKDRLHHSPPQPACRHVPFRANPERDAVKRFRKRLCCQTSYLLNEACSFQSLSPGIRTFAFTYLTPGLSLSPRPSEVSMSSPKQKA